uniref:Uncharacterized protein n=1 Tax=Zea mays TaxID=4577 RepID=A0A804PNP1_MAIZE
MIDEKRLRKREVDETHVVFVHRPVSFFYSDQEREEENAGCHKNKGLEGRHVITAGVGRVVPAAPPVLPRVVGVVHPVRWEQPRERPPPHQRRGLSPPLPVPAVPVAVASAARCGLAAAVGRGPGSRQLVPADRAGVVQAEPRHDAVGVVDVLARQLPRGLPELEVLLAHGALRAVRQVCPGDPHRRERVDGRRRRRRRPRPVVLRQLLDEVVQVRPREVVPEVDGRGRGRPPQYRRRRRRGGHAPSNRRRRRSRMRGRSLRRRSRLAERAAWYRRRRLPAVYDPAARVAVVLALRVERVRQKVRRRERGARRQVDLVEEAAEAARAEDVGGRVGDDAERAAALVAPVHAARPVAHGRRRRRHRRGGGCGSLRRVGLMVPGCLPRSAAVALGGGGWNCA